MTSFRLEYSESGDPDWSDVTDGSGLPAMFDGNVDSTSLKENTFISAVIASFMRIYPLTHRNAAALRWGLIGCSIGKHTMLNRALDLDFETDPDSS